jgi:hypothetical protein
MLSKGAQQAEIRNICFRRQSGTCASLVLGESDTVRGQVKHAIFARSHACNGRSRVIRRRRGCGPALHPSGTQRGRASVQASMGRVRRKTGEIPRALVPACRRVHECGAPSLRGFEMAHRRHRQRLRLTFGFHAHIIPWRPSQASCRIPERPTLISTESAFDAQDRTMLQSMHHGNSPAQ